jgi:hypothetical protein
MEYMGFPIIQAHQGFHSPTHLSFLLSLCYLRTLCLLCSSLSLSPNPKQIMLSPYADRTGELFTQINQQLISLLNLRSPYKMSDILPGERYGFIEVRSLDADKRDVRTGYCTDTFELELLVSAGCETFSQAVGLGAVLMLEVSAAIPLLKRTLQSGSIHDLIVRGDIVAVKRQTLKPAIDASHAWIVDVSCNLQAPIAIYKDANGEHIQDDNTVLG